MGSAESTITDYPADALLANITLNLERNSHQLRPAATSVEDTDVSAHHVCEHLWGDDVAPILRDRGRFDLIMAAECLWKHTEHRALLSTIARSLSREGEALVSFSHHIPGLEHQGTWRTSFIVRRFQSPCLNPLRLGLCIPWQTSPFSISPKLFASQRMTTTRLSSCTPSTSHRKISPTCSQAESFTSSTYTAWCGEPGHWRSQKQPMPQ